MKMMISTSNTSIMGVMLISALGPPEPPTAIDIELLLLSFLLLALWRSPRGGRRRAWAVLRNRFGQQSQLIHARGTQVIDNVHYLFVAGARVGSQENHFVGATRQQILHLLRKLVGRHLVVA